ncbi:serine/threonine-protein kinase [Jiangella sp. DSM 45060]|uniref:serine/threonine-protein kinase n=1 Tax=Jiangella sp. DSM 45060 TaxID=1798224 RepID=UPI00087C3B2D|nr:serine/threonine-protein kinase [Jiangella sp. DSM 45060]SDT02962.1 serine/threonine protein kinase [Jiangella sp. DSM 45060]
MGEVFAGRYELVDVLGRGGMGDVWRVWDLRERVFRAAKLQRQSDGAALLRFVRESSTRVDHPHVLTPSSWWADDGRVLFVMPIVAGGSVAVLLADHGALGDWWTATLGGQLLAGLAAVHAAGLVHRDVKPSNLLLEPTGVGAPLLRLSDFGIAARTDEPRLTNAAEVVHTPGYSAPEARRGADPDPRQDLYAAGVVLTELLTGRRPDATSEVTAPPGPLAGVIARLVATDPAGRFGSAAEALDALRSVPIPPPPPSAEPVEVFEQLPPWPAGWGPGGPTPTAPPPADAHLAPGPAPAATVVQPVPDGDASPAVARTSRRWPWPAVALAVVGAGLVVAAVVTALT